MPNTPCLVGAGASVFCPGDKATSDDIVTTNKLFSSIGTCDQISESLLDVVTALSGSGPAYVSNCQPIFLFGPIGNKGPVHTSRGE